MDVAEDRNMLTDRLGLKQNTQENEDNRINSIQDELPTNIGSTPAGIEHINGRITKLEHSIVELTNTINGVMNELMDQKSILSTLNNSIHDKNQGGANMRGADMREGRHLLRPHHQHGFNVRNAGNINDDSEGSSRLHPRHNQGADMQQGNTGAGSGSDYIIADVDRSAQNRDDDSTHFKGEYIIADDSPVPARKKQESNIHYNDEEDVVVYVNENDDK